LRVALAVPVTVKVAVAVLLPAVTVMLWATAVAPDGIVITLLKLPLLSVWVLPVGVSGVVSNVKTREVLARKFKPLTATLVPAGPEAGERALRAALMVPVTEKVAVAETAAVPVPAVAVMVCESTVAVDGMDIAVVKRPLLLVATSPDEMGMAKVSNLNDNAILGGKLAPVTVTWVPAAPEAGIRALIDGLAVTVKVAVAETAAVPVPAVTVMVWALAVAVNGMVI
jgi:hypothetical protein